MGKIGRQRNKSEPSETGAEYVPSFLTLNFIVASAKEYQPSDRDEVIREILEEMGIKMTKDLT